MNEEEREFCSKKKKQREIVDAVCKSRRVKIIALGNKQKWPAKVMIQRTKKWHHERLRRQVCKYIYLFHSEMFTYLYFSEFKSL